MTRTLKVNPFARLRTPRGTRPPKIQVPRKGPYRRHAKHRGRPDPA